MMYLLDKMPVTLVPSRSPNCRPLFFQVPGSTSALDADQLSVSKMSKTTPKSSRRSMKRGRSSMRSRGNSTPESSVSLEESMDYFFDDGDSLTEIGIDDASCDDLCFDDNVNEKFAGLQEFVTDDSGEPSIALVMVDIIEGVDITDGFKSLMEPIVTLQLGVQSEHSFPGHSGIYDKTVWNERKTLAWNGKDRLRVAVSDRGVSTIDSDPHYIGMHSRMHQFCLTIK